VEGVFESFATPGWVLHWINVPLWRLAWADQDELRTLNRWQVMIDHFRMAQSNSWTSLASRHSETSISESASGTSRDGGEEELTWWDRFRFLFSTSPFSIGDTLIRRTLSTQVQQQMVMTAVALRRYQLHSGRLPADLTALVPDYLVALPRDRMDGQTLRYHLLPTGGFALYSVGEDGKDDGGDPRPNPASRDYRQIWNGRDALWPIAATVEEALTALKSERRPGAGAAAPPATK
jgi:hypothetical protein